MLDNGIKARIAGIAEQLEEIEIDEFNPDSSQVKVYRESQIQ